MPSRYWVRAFYTALTSSKGVEDVLAFCKKSQAHGILLLTHSFDTEPALLPPDEVQKRAAALRRLVPEFSLAGLEVHINVMSTLGHGPPSPTTVESLGFAPMVDHLGNPSPTTPCPMDPAFLTYAADLYAAMAATGATAIWVDDDVRYAGHDTPGTGCFCERHLEAVGERLGNPITREELVPLLSTDDPVPNPEGMVWHGVNAEAIRECATTIRKAVDGVSRKIELGLMTVGATAHAAEGRDTPELMETLGPKQTRWFRPGSGFWNDERPLEVVSKSEDAFRQVCVAGERIRPVSEVENYPYTSGGKSRTMLRLELQLNALAGLHDQSLNLFDGLHGVREGDDELASLLSETKPRLDALAEEIGGKRRAGIGVAFEEAVGAFLPPGGTRWFGRQHWDENLARLGLPLGEPTGAPHLVTGLMANVVGPEQVEQLVSEGLILDGAAAWQFQERGIAGLIGLKTVRPVEGCGYERFTGDALNGAYAERLMAWRPSAGDTPTYAPEPASMSARIVSRLFSLGGSDLGAGILALPRETGGRIVVLPWALPHASQIVNGPRRAQMQALVRWVSGGALPATAHGSPNSYPIVWTNEQDDERLVAVANLSSDAAEEIAIRLDGGSWAVDSLDEAGTWKRSDAVVAGSSYRAGVRPWSVDVRRLKRAG